MRHAFSETTLKNSADEEVFWKWLDELPSRLGSTIAHKLRELQVRLAKHQVEEIGRRVVDVLLPWIERSRRLWIESFPHREKRRRDWEALSRSLGLDKKVKTRENCYGWFNAQEEYARLAKRYSGFDEEWSRFYEEYVRECKGKALMGDEMRSTFNLICFLRGEHNGEARPIGG
jgi:hypothetical protein